MIISASYRSDIPAFHAAWFEVALKKGAIEVKNPYSNRTYHIDLSPEAVDGYVFWTRNVRSFRHILDRIEAQARPMIFHMSVLNYPRIIEPSTPSVMDAVDQARWLAKRLGPYALVWRYDPIFLAQEMNVQWHRRNFSEIARELSGSSDEVIVSFAEFYEKSRRNLAKAGIEWRDPAIEEKMTLLFDLGKIATEFGFRLTVCANPDLSARTELAPARCIDAERLSKIAGKTISALKKTPPNRPGCLCAEARDIGRYDSCAHGCRYCYAVSDHEKAAKKLKKQSA